MSSVKMIYSLLMFLLIATVNSIPLDQFLPFNTSKLCLIDAITGLIHVESKDTPGLPGDKINTTSCLEFSIGPNDDASSHNISLSFAFPFFAKRFKNVFVNTNGIISFTSPVTRFSPHSFPLRNRFLIAPFWADVDTRGTGEIYFKETTDINLLKKANRIIQRATHQAAGLSRFIPRWMLIVTWYKVGYYTKHTDKVNTFQALLVTNGIQSFVVFNYLDDGINWNKGDASYVPAQVGFNFGERDNVQKFTLPNSRTEMISDIEMESNTNNNGQFVFRVDERVNNETCTANTGHLIVDPNTPSIINGGVMKLSGPCFSTTNEKITCKFYDASDTPVNEAINGIITIHDKGNEKAICPMPFFNTLGRHSVFITIDNSITYNGTFTVVPALYKKPDVKVFSENSETDTEFALIEHNTNYTAKWDPEILNVNEFDEPGNVSLKFQNWILGINFKKWFDRKKRRGSQADFLDIINNETDKGKVTFKQTRNEFSGVKFDISLLVLIKTTKNLEIHYASSFLSFLPKRGGLTGTKAVINNCQNWHSRTGERLNSAQLTNCPCKLKSVMFNKDFESDPTCSATKTDCHENVDANRCYLKKITGTIGQQCCYNSDGEYTKSGKSAGSSDYSYPMEHYLKHQISDYFPYRACCIESKDSKICETYYELRPLENNTTKQCDSNSSEKVGNAGGNGDPHFITLDGKQYTFNGLGEYTLLDALDGEFIIQIQTKQAVDQNGDAINASSISVITMKQKNKPTVQAHLHNVLGIEVVVESDLNNDGYDKLDFEYVPVSQFDGGRVSVETDFSRLFSFENGVVIIVKAANDILSFQLSIPETFYDKTKGLLGVWNNKQDDDFLIPDGTTISIQSTEEEIFHQFGEKWRVDGKDSLLIIVRNAPTATTTNVNTYVPLFDTPPVDDTTKKLIEETCGDNSECAYDIAITGNVDVGKETLNDIEEHMIIVNLTLPIICDPPCQNDAPCVANDTCNCINGFTGPTCAEKIIKCDTPCENGGNCSGLELCDCPKDYYGQHCDVYNPCLLSPCQQDCIVGRRSYICQCDEGYILAANGFSCIKCAAFNTQGEVNATWQVALCNASNDDTICSGTAISDQWVMTSARCACINGSNIEGLSIRYGKTRTCFYRDTNEVRLSASETYCFPNFTSDKVSIDLAVIKLATPLSLNTLNTFPPLCFDTKRRDNKDFFFAGGSVEMFGWGKVGEVISEASTIKSSGNVTVDKNLDCEKTFEEEGLEFVVGMMCTIADTTKACTGNHGSGLITQDDVNKVLLGGVASRSTKVCGSKDSYVAHTRLYTKEVIQWIRGVIQS